MAAGDEVACRVHGVHGRLRAPRETGRGASPPASTKAAGSPNWPARHTARSPAPSSAPPASRAGAARRPPSAAPPWAGPLDAQLQLKPQVRPGPRPERPARRACRCCCRCRPWPKTAAASSLESCARHRPGALLRPPSGTRTRRSSAAPGSAHPPVRVQPPGTGCLRREQPRGSSAAPQWSCRPRAWQARPRRSSDAPSPADPWHTHLATRPHHRRVAPTASPGPPCRAPPH